MEVSFHSTREYNSQEDLLFGISIVGRCDIKACNGASGSTLQRVINERAANVVGINYAVFVANNVVAVTVKGTRVFAVCTATLYLYSLAQVFLFLIFRGGKRFHSAALNVILTYLVGFLVCKEAKEVYGNKECKECKRYKLNPRLSHDWRQSGEEWDAVYGRASTLCQITRSANARFGKIYSYCRCGKKKRGKYDIGGYSSFSHDARAADKHTKLKVEHACRNGEHKADKIVSYDSDIFCRKFKQKYGADYVYG
jgi:hypothetical protein